TSKDTAKETSKETAQETLEEAVEAKPGVAPSIVMMESVEEEVCTLGEVEEEEKKMSEEETKVEATNAGQVTDVVMEEQQGDQKEVVMRLEPLLDTEKVLAYVLLCRVPPWAKFECVVIGIILLP
ncbi:unnamed protein product, partial [Ixodes pacificus]